MKTRVVGPRSKPRRERTQEHRVMVTCAVLGSDLRFAPALRHS
jgi:hypothetical protein